MIQSPPIIQYPLLLKLRETSLILTISSLSLFEKCLSNAFYPKILLPNFLPDSISSQAFKY